MKALLSGWHCRRAAWHLRRLARPGSIILDAGCGDSPYGRALGDCCVIGVDIKKTSGVSIIADLGALPFGDAIFDGAICFQVLYYTPHPVTWLREMQRVLKASGWLVMSVSRPAAVKREQKSCPQRPLLAWQASQWETLAEACGFINITPKWERLAARYFGAYIFGLYRKP